MCVTLHDWVLAEEFPAWAEVKSMLPELRSLWHHPNNLSSTIMARCGGREVPRALSCSCWFRRLAENSTAFPVLSCIVVRRTFGTDEDAGAVGGSFLLDRYGG